jgi:GT2 family glycosyltransferase
VIVPHLDDLDRLACCLTALDRQSLPRHAFEVIVGDNGSACGIAAVRAIAKGARVIAVAERGAGPARNAAAVLARGDVLAFIDSDCVPHPDWLRAGLAALAHADLVGGAVDVSVEDPQRPTGPEAFELVFAFDNRRYVEELGFSVTANLFTTRAVFDAVGGFRTGVPEDLDWCRRAQAAGYRIAFAEDARVLHPARVSHHDLAQKWRRLTREAFADHLDHGRGPWRWLVRAGLVLVSPLGHAPRLLGSTVLPSGRARLAALGTLFRIRAQRAWWMLQLASRGACAPGRSHVLGSTPQQTKRST